MLVFWNERLVFLAVPKTGTTALQQALASRSSLVFRDPPGVKHLSARRYRRFVAPMLSKLGDDRFETVAVMREPVDWLGSWFRYRSRPQLAGDANSTAGRSFDEFVLAYLENPQPGFAAVGGQAQFLSDSTGQCDVDHLFSYAEFGALTAFLEDRLGQPIKLPKANVSPKGDVTLSPPVETRLRRKYRRDFELYGSIPNRSHGQ